MENMYYRFTLQHREPGRDDPRVYVAAKSLWSALNKFMDHDQYENKVRPRLSLDHYAAQPFTRDEFMEDFDPTFDVLLNN